MAACILLKTDITGEFSPKPLQEDRPGVRVEPAPLLPVSVVCRGGIGELVEQRPLGMKDDDAPEIRSLRSPFRQGPEE